MRLLLAATLLLTPAFATADDAPRSRTPDASQMKADDCARARKQKRTCTIDMGEGESIEGNSPTAGGAAIGVVSFGKAASLIRIRRDFIVEILKSAEDLD